MATLPELIVLGPAVGRLKSTREQPLAMPYAHVTCEFLRSDRAVAYRLDRRKVTITIYGVRADVVAAAAAVLAVFNRNMGKDAQHPGLTYPSGAKFVSWIPSVDDDLKLEPAEKQGKDIWRGVIEATVTSTRTP